MKNIALNILDIVQNSISAGASEIAISITESLKNDTLELRIADNGKGMDRETAENVLSPFFTTRVTRSVGLGLPLLKQQSEQAGGGISILSEKGKGTEVKAWFRLTSIDRQPLGDIAGTLTILIGSNPDIDFLYSHNTDSGDYSISTREIREYFGVQSVTDYGLLKEIGGLVNANLEEIGVSELNYKE